MILPVNNILIEASIINKIIIIVTQTVWNTDNLTQLNLGPQHPSTHGVLRIIAFVKGETIKWLQPEIGLLHRGTEKLIEYRNLNQSIP